MLPCTTLIVSEAVPYFIKEKKIRKCMKDMASTCPLNVVLLGKPAKTNITGKCLHYKPIGYNHEGDQSLH